jgi:hypothetical protein
MNDLQISLTGKITETNFDEWKGALIKQIAGSNRELATDDDFALAEQDVKTLRAGEKALKAAKQSALEQAAEIQKLFEAIDEVSDKARQARLSLERQIKQRKAEIRDDIVDGGMQAIDDHLKRQSELFKSVNHENFMSRAQLLEFTKGKRSYKSMQKAIDDTVAEVQSRIDARATGIADNEKTLVAIDEQYTSLFQDKETLLVLSADDLANTIDERISFYQTEQARLQAEQADSAPPPESTDQPEPEVDPAPEESDDSPVNTVIDNGTLARFTISIEVFADKSDATEFLDELEGRFGHREMVGEITLHNH